MVTATSEAEARELARDAGLFARQAGDTFFLEFRDIPLTRSFGPSGRVLASTLILPGDIEVEVDGDQNEAGLEMVLDYLEADWSISNSGPIRVTLNQDLNVQVEAYSWTAEMLQGGIRWEIQNAVTESSRDTTSTHPSNQKLPVPSYNQSEPEILARATVGKGGSLLRLSSRDTIIINAR